MLPDIQNNLNRWYNPRLGKLISQDPIGFAGGDANLYRYVGNSPTIYVDPFGLADEVPDANGGTQAGPPVEVGEHVDTWRLLNPFSWCDAGRGSRLDAQIRARQTQSMLAETDLSKQLSAIKRLNRTHAQRAAVHAEDLITLNAAASEFVVAGTSPLIRGPGTLASKRPGGLGYPGSMRSAPKSVWVGGLPGRSSLTNAQARQWYVDNVKAIGDQIDTSLPLRRQALQAFRRRIEIRQMARDLMSDRALADSLPPMRTLQDIVKRKYDRGLVGDDLWCDVLRSAQTPDPNVNALFGIE